LLIAEAGFFSDDLSGAMLGGGAESTKEHAHDDTAYGGIENGLGEVFASE
jgi:hypothetical protein